MDTSLPSSSVHWILQARIPSPGDLPNQGTEPTLEILYHLRHQGSPIIKNNQILLPPLWKVEDKQII